ncbi:MAG: NAD(P)/FAD-dependent oxidoreductase [Clostridia bacterium]|nr:NAD(P)/FAD-dependent oxidoreductase [Clostridia bacterium]
MKNICIIGGGASGAMAAISAAECGADVTIIEKNEKLMKKLYITGKGRCNITNSAYYEDFLQNILRGRKFFMSSFTAYDNYAVIDFFKNNGLAVKEERGGRIFPASDKSSDVIKVLENKLRNLNVKTILNYDVKKIEKTKDKFVVNEDLQFDNVIICAGGSTYKSTGSDGSIYTIAERLGHEVTEILPGLTGLAAKGLRLNDLQGVSLLNVSLTASLGKKQIYSELGEMLFTHFGISGPLVLSMSSLLDKDKMQDYTVYIDLKPALDEEKLYNRIMRDFEKEPKRAMKNVLRRLLPAALIDSVLEKSQISGDIVCNQVTAEQRRSLVKTLKFFIIDIEGFYKLDLAIITRGGVNLKEINPKTMESKIVPGLYFAGEVLDIDALTGGYNLQVAFSTGYCAGKHCASS